MGTDNVILFVKIAATSIYYIYVCSSAEEHRLFQQVEFI